MNASAPAVRAESETIGSFEGGAVNASSASAGRAESETIGASQRGCGGRLLGLGRKGQKRPQRSINVRYRPRER